jgi:hypothetical protein
MADNEISRHHLQFFCIALKLHLQSGCIYCGGAEIVFRNTIFFLVGLIFLSRYSFAEPSDRLVVVVEDSDWVAEAKKIACHLSEFRVWESGTPMWFEEFSGQETRILVLFDTQRSGQPEAIWRERLKAQGCKVVSVPIDRSVGQVTATQIHKRVHSALIEMFPDRESIWNDNLQRVMRTKALPNVHQSLSWFAAFVKPLPQPRKGISR